MPQPPDSVLLHVVTSRASLAGAGQQLSGGGAVWAAVEAHHLPQAAIVKGAPCVSENLACRALVLPPTTPTSFQNAAHILELRPDCHLDKGWLMDPTWIVAVVTAAGAGKLNTAACLCLGIVERHAPLPSHPL